MSRRDTPTWAYGFWKSPSKRELIAEIERLTSENIELQSRLNKSGEDGQMLQNPKTRTRHVRCLTHSSDEIERLKAKTKRIMGAVSEENRALWYQIMREEFAERNP